jgi:hypothetical protein
MNMRASKVFRITNYTFSSQEQEKTFDGTNESMCIKMRL